MTKILIVDGTCGEGPGSYEYGVFSLPDGSVRGVEDLADLSSAAEPGPATRRSGVARGLREALAATGPLPRPLGLAASVVGVGLDVLGGDGRSDLILEARFADGAVASIRTDAASAAQMSRDRDVVRRAALRRALPSEPSLAAVPGGDAPGAAVPGTRAVEAPEPEAPEAEAPALASLFAYEKRGGRLRRLAAKARDDG